MGKEDKNELVAQIAIKSIKSFFRSNFDGDYLDRLKISVDETNDFIYNRSNGNSNIENVATTIDLLYLKGNMAYIAHVGDSRIYHLKNGNLKQLTKDHSLVQKLVDEGFLTYKEAENHPEKNVVMKAIGKKGFIETDLLKLKLNEYDNNKFFICSDGVSSLITNNEIGNLLKLNTCDSIITAIPEIIISRGAYDDFSFIFIENE
jgi:protein phosphatase